MAGGLFDAFQRAVDLGRARRAQDEEQQYVRDERAYQRDRRATLDPLQDEMLGLQVGEARFNAGTQPLRQRGLEAQTVGAETAAELGRFNLGRAPTIAAQQDASHEAGMAQAGLNMQLARNRDARESARHSRDLAESDYRLQAQKLQLDLAKVETQRKALQDQWMRSRQQIFQLGTRGDAEGVLSTINQLYEQVDDGNPDSGVRFDPGSRRYYVADETGAPIQDLGDINGLLDFADLYVSSPEIFAQSYVGQRAAAAERAAAAAKAEAARLAEEGKNFRAGLGAAGQALSNPLNREGPAGVVGPLVDAASQIAGAAPGATAGAAGQANRPVPADVVARALREIPPRHIELLLANANDPMALARFEEKYQSYGPGVAAALIQQYAQQSRGDQGAGR